MKKLIGGILALGILLFGGVPAHALDTDNYTITNFDVKMTLSRDSEQRSVLRTVETITAQFPDYDQNHGLERVFVKEYDGHTIGFELVSVTDGEGRTLPYHWSGDALRIGNADAYVHGSQTYVITYSQYDVTRYYADTNRDEFYWDVIGTEWRVPIEKAAVHLEVESALRASLSGDKACYVGVSGSTSTCEVRTTASGYETSTTDIGNGKGVTLAIGFAKGTFTAYQPSLLERILPYWVALQFVWVAVGVVIIVWTIVRWRVRLNRSKEMGTIVAEYLPPKNASVTTSAKVGAYRMSVMTAQLLDLAVRHYIKIYEVKAKTLFTPAQYEIEVIQDVSGLRWEEQELLKDTFGSLPTVDQRLNLKSLQNNTAYSMRLLNNDSDLTKLIRGEYAFREADPVYTAQMRKIASFWAVVGLVTVSPVLLFVVLVPLIESFMSWRLTDTGLALRRYLKGLKLYIGVAEQERIKMLQSPEGAEKVASVAAGTDNAQLVKLYERVLPYAVLFGQEKEWNQQLGKYYETSGTQPDWYSGHAAFNAIAFSTAMSSFSTASNYASSSSSSTGGSGGGGFSGGGGGGGGGGGW